MVRPLREDVTLIPIISVGDTLAPPDTVSETYMFAQAPDGIGVRKTSNGVAELYVAHEISWSGGYRGARVSRLAIDLRNLGALAGDYVVDGSEGYSTFGAATLVGGPQGFLAPTFLVNEDAVDGFYSGTVAAVDVRDGFVTNLPWLGHFAHVSTAIVPVSSGKIAAIMTEDWNPGESQLYMYLAANDTNFLTGRGQLYVFHADAPAGLPNTRLSSMARKSRPLTGKFIPIFPDEAPTSVGELPSRLESQVQSASCLNFVHPGDVAPDHSQPNAFYFVDAGAEEYYDPITGRPVTGAGRLYFVRLDPFNPTNVVEFRVVLDGDEADDLYRPDNIDTDDRYVWIQENPGERGIHTARILRYDTQTRRIEPMAECAERDAKGPLLPKGIGGDWESTGIVDASSAFGPDSWLIAVQARNLWLPQFRNRRGGGQLLLLRGPGYPRPKREEK
jgi:hypothetical protein